MKVHNLYDKAYMQKIEALNKRYLDFKQPSLNDEELVELWDYYRILVIATDSLDGAFSLMRKEIFRREEALEDFYNARGLTSRSL